MSVKELETQEENTTNNLEETKNNSIKNSIIATKQTKINQQNNIPTTSETDETNETQTSYTPNEFHTIEPQKNNLSTLGILGIIGIILIIIVAICFSIFTIFNNNNENIVTGISIKNIDVSGLSKTQAKEKVENYIKEKLPENILLKHNDFETSIPLSSIEVNFDIDGAIDQALQIGKSGNIIQNSFEALKVMLYPIDIEPNFSLNEQLLIDALNDISTKLPDTVIESSYYIENNNLILTSGKAGNVVNINQMESYIKNGIMNLTLKNRTLDIATSIKQPSKINIEKVYEEVHKEAKDAYYTQNPFSVYPSENGMDFAISLEEASKMLEEEKEEYKIPLKILYPKVTTNMIGTEAFPDLLSSFSTKYNARDTDRTTNLKLAANKINGTVLMPGETFSYNQVVGARTIAAGYKEAPIYVQGQVVDGLGGGICQITSTLYNAVLFANLEIVERSNHQFVPSYVSASRDATVVYGSIDFKFKNNRNYPIKLICSVANGIANFQIFGLKTENDYEVTISSYETGRTSNAIYSEAYKILKKNGQVVVRQLLSRDVYKRH